jgi:hypothetical protein
VTDGEQSLQRESAPAPLEGEPVHHRCSRCCSNRYAPASVVINRRHEIVFLARARRPLPDPAPRAPTDDLTHARLARRAAEPRCARHGPQGGDARSSAGRDRRSGRSGPAPGTGVRVTVEPLGHPRRREGLIMVSFADGEPEKRVSRPRRSAAPSEAENIARAAAGKNSSDLPEDLESTIGRSRDPRGAPGRQ